MISPIFRNGKEAGNYSQLPSKKQRKNLNHTDKPNYDYTIRNPGKFFKSVCHAEGKSLLIFFGKMVMTYEKQRATDGTKNKNSVDTLQLSTKIFYCHQKYGTSQLLLGNNSLHVDFWTFDIKCQVSLQVCQAVLLDPKHIEIH